MGSGDTKIRAGGGWSSSPDLDPKLDTDKNTSISRSMCTAWRYLGFRSNGIGLRKRRRKVTHV